MRVSSMVMVTSDLSEPIGFSLSDSDPQNEYIVKNITGLDAEDITPKFYGFSLYTRSRFYNFSLKPRDIVMLVVLNPRFVLNESYSDVRDQLYKAISATRTGLINLQFKAGATTVAQLFGSIVKFESTYFEQLPSVQLTIRCSDPLFRAITPVDYSSEEFPTTNPVHIYDSLSTAPHGFVMDLNVTHDFTTFTVKDRSTDPEWSFDVTLSGGFNVGDIIHFSSEFSNKYIWVERPATDPLFLMDAVNSGSQWPILFPGDNEFYVANFGELEFAKLTFFPAYWGV